MHGRNVRQRGSWMAALVCLLPAPMVAAQVPDVPARLLAPLENAAVQLARANRPADVEELLNFLRQLGLDEESLPALRRTCDLELARDRRRQDPVPAIARTLRQAADRLALVGDEGIDEDVLHTA